MMTRTRILAHAAAYPMLAPRDLLKYLYQSAYGCEHLVSNSAEVTSRLLAEAASLEEGCDPATVRLDGAYDRVPLTLLKEGLAATTLSRLFLLSARHEEEGDAALNRKLAIARTLAREGVLPFSDRELAEEIAAWQSEGCPAVRHSERFRAAYHPAYRVLAHKYAAFLPLFIALDRALAKGPVRLAIEGGAASGKTTLGRLLEDVYGATVLHMDDFFLRPSQRTPERLGEPGGNVDHERFLAEVLLPLSRNEEIAYRRFDCATRTLLPPIRILPGHLTVVEGAYSMHPTLAEHYDLSVFLAVPAPLQTARIARRNSPDMAERFAREWIPMERRYFEAMHVRERCSITIEIDE